MEILRQQRSAEWNRFVSENSGPPFTSWEWGELCSTYGHEPLRLVARNGGETVGCLQLVHVESQLFGDTLVSMPYSEHGGIVLADAESREEARSRLLETAQSLADERDVSYLCLRGARDPGTDAYLRFNTAVTFSLHTGGGTDRLWEDAETRFRTAVRRGRDTGIRVHRATSREDVGTFYDLYLSTLRRHGVPPHSESFFERMWNTFHDRNRLEILFAYPPGDEEPLNTVLLLPFGDTVYYKHAASRPAAQQYEGGSLLLWKSIEWACENEFTTFDLGRTRKGSGVYDFKRSLNGRELYLDDLYYYPNGFVPPPTPDQSAFSPLMRLWSRLPRTVTAVLGPYVRRGLA